MRIEERDGVRILRLEEGKGNAIGPPFVAALEAALDQIDRTDPSPVVITGQGKCFSAGLELPVLVALDREAMRGYITRYERLMMRIFELPLPVVAAVNGHAIAGGCVLALQCDVRIGAAGNWKMGLNETQLGIGLPAVVFETLRCQVPAASLVPVALEGRLFEPEWAREVGLLDAIVDPSELEERAVERARELGRIGRTAFAAVKAAMRRPAVEAAARNIEAECERWLDTWFSPEAKKLLAATLARLDEGRRSAG